MKGLQHKCLVASACLHGMLLLIVLIGSAFVTRKVTLETPSFELIEIPKNLVDEENVWGGGNPNVVTPQLPTPGPVAPAPRETTPPPPPKEVTPEPEKQPKEVVKPEPEAPTKVPEIKPEPRTKQPDPDAFDLNKAVTKTSQTPKPEKAPTNFDFAKAERKTIKPPKDAKASPDGEEGGRGDRERQAANAKAGAISEALRRVQGGLTSVGGSYEVPGPGGNSLSYTLALRKRYQDAWVGAATAGRNGVLVEVEIAKDGTVVNAKILKKSGNSEYDRAADSTIKRVRKVDPLPSGVKEATKVYRFEIVPNEIDRG